MVEARDQLAKSFPKVGPLSTNPLEQLNKEIKRRSRLVGILPKPAAGVRGRLADPLPDILDALGPEAEIDTAEPLARQCRVLSELGRERMH
ncbi:transposase [Nocardioides dilutus]